MLLEGWGFETQKFRGPTEHKLLDNLDAHPEGGQILWRVYLYPASNHHVEELGPRRVYNVPQSRY